MITQDIDMFQVEVESVTKCNLLPEDLVQGSREWKEFRKNKLGASDAPTIMGVSPYETPYQLWCRKLGLLPEPDMTGAMQRGHDLEPLALAEFERQLGLFMRPTVRVSKTTPWMMASLDGLCLDDKVAVEIKCPNLETHQIALDGKVPDKYIYHNQHHHIDLQEPS